MVVKGCPRGSLTGGAGCTPRLTSARDTEYPRDVIAMASGAAHQVPSALNATPALVIAAMRTVAPTVATASLNSDVLVPGLVSMGHVSADLPSPLSSVRLVGG